ncbi:MAG: transcription antitermination factor NusB [Gemmatimonadales bacterium]
MSPGLAARTAAWRILHDVHRGVPFDLAIDRAFGALTEEADRRLAHELAAGALRQRARLDGAIAPHVSLGLDSVRPDLLDILRLGAYQLLFLERVPPHAAVSTSVELARRVSGARVGAFVNAVLRRVATAGDRGSLRGGAAETVEAAPACATDLAAASSHPEWLVERWVARFGLDETERLLSWNNRRPSLVLQPARWDADAITAALDRAGVRWARAPYDAGIVVETSRPRELPGFASGAFQVQDPAQALVLRFFETDAATVFDACAAPGGKTVGLSRSGRTVVAADRRRDRIRRLVGNLGRAASGPAFSLLASADRPPVRPVGAVLLDVPCLGTGALARNPDARWRVSADALEGLTEQASRFLRAQAEIVRPGGWLLFSTCSLEPEENETQVDAFLAADTRFRREPGASAPADLLTAAGDLMILPQRHGMDGAYAARLRRVA